MLNLMEGGCVSLLEIPDLLLHTLYAVLVGLKDGSKINL